MRAICLLLCSIALVSAQKPNSAAPVPENPAVTAAREALSQGREEQNTLKKSAFLSAMVAGGNTPETVAILEDALANEKHPELRQTAAAVLGDVKSTKSIPKLKAALEDEALEVSYTAARSLWNMGDTTGREIFQQILSGDRGTSSSGLIKSQLRDVRNRMQNPAGLALFGVKEGLGMFLGPAAMGVTVVEELRKDGGATARTLSAALLATDKNPASIVTLEDGLSDKNWIVRAACIKALADRGSVASIPKISGILDDKQEGSRYMAASAILRLNGIVAKPKKTVKR